MLFFILLNTIPCYYKEFENKKDAEDFGFALRCIGEVEHQKFRYKVMNKKPRFLENKRFNGYELRELDDSLYEIILGELTNADFKIS